MTDILKMTDAIYRIDPPNTDLGEVVDEAIRLAQKRHITVQFNYGWITVRVRARSRKEGILRDYKEALRGNRARWIGPCEF